MDKRLSKAVMEDICTLAQKNGVKRVILFGSRARGTNTEKSDIDLAVNGGDAAAFYLDLEEKARTLLTFDVVSLDGAISAELRGEIQRDGVVIYEKI